MEQKAAVKSLFERVNGTPIYLAVSQALKELRRKHGGG